MRALEWVLTQYVSGSCPDFGLLPVVQPSEAALYAILQCSTLDAAAAVNKTARIPLSLPPIPAVYNLLLQPAEGQKMVPEILRSLMEPSSSIGWLYSQVIHITFHQAHRVPCLSTLFFYKFSFSLHYFFFTFFPQRSSSLFLV